MSIIKFLKFKYGKYHFELWRRIKHKNLKQSSMKCNRKAHSFCTVLVKNYCIKVIIEQPWPYLCTVQCVCMPLENTEASDKVNFTIGFGKYY